MTKLWHLPVSRRRGRSVGTAVASGGGSANVVTEYDLAVGAETNPYGTNHNAFPTAMGWGKDSEGARNLSAGDGSDITVRFVTNRNDSGPGSLREAMEATGRRIIIPLVGGWVDLLSSISVTDGRLTFLGNFIPSGSQGLWLRNRQSSTSNVVGNMIYVSTDAAHLIVRFLGIPRGFHPNFAGQNLEGNGNAWTQYGTTTTQHYAIWDHVTTAFTTDNCIVHLNSDEVTIQNNAFLDTVAKGAHTKTDHHDYGPHLFGADYVSFMANFITRTRDRNPMVDTGPAVVLGNLAYNCYILPSSRMAGPDGTEQDFIRNYHREGPYLGAIYWMRIDDYEGNGNLASIYMEANAGDEVTDGQGWADIDYRTPATESAVRRNTAQTPVGTIPTRTAEEWRDYVHRWAGVKYVVDPDTGDLANREWSFQAQRLSEALARTGPDAELFSTDVEAFYTSDPVDTWAIAGADAAAMESTFWTSYYQPWASANGYGTTETAAKSVDATTGYTPLELYMMDLTPVYDYLTWDALTWTA